LHANLSDAIVTSPRKQPLWGQLRVLLGERRWLIVLLGIGSVLSGVTEAGVLAIVAEVAAALVSRRTGIHIGIGPLHANASIWALLATAFGLALVRIALQVIVSSLPARIASEVQGNLRRRIFGSFTEASWAMQSRDREGHLQELMTSQVMQVSLGAVQAATMVGAFFMFGVLVIAALALDLVAAALVLGAAIALFALMRPIHAVGGRNARAFSQAQMLHAGGVSEANRLAKETRVFGAAAAQRDRINVLIARSETLFFHTQYVMRLVPNLYQSSIYLVLVGGLATIYAVDRGHVASLGAVVLLLVRAGLYGQQIQGSYTVAHQALPFLERLEQAKQRYIASALTSGTNPMPTVAKLTLQHVSFAYQADRPVLSDINCEIHGNETVGIVGPSGAGKSTLVDILLSLQLPNTGKYLINDMPVQQFRREDWQARVAYVPQEPRLIHDSIAANIRYFRELDDDAVVRAAELARIHDDVQGWPNGYDTIVGPRADAVSGGQQQRICLARALAAQPEILILDEPTSSLDPHSECLIQESLAALKHRVTLFIVAHRMSTLDICDRVIVIVDGRLDAFDTTARLVQNSPYYRTASNLAAGAASNLSAGAANRLQNEEDSSQPDNGSNSTRFDSDSTRFAESGRGLAQ
jgi:ABC-type multidrug transport system fused ATPase/permease subunit